MIAVSFGHANIIRQPAWSIPDRKITPESTYVNRREFLRQLGFAGTGLLATSMVGCSQNDSSVVPTITQDVQKFYGKGHSHPRNEELNPNWQLTNERTAATYNNFYEFTLGKDQVHRMVSTLIVSPREIDITGDIKKPQKIDAPRRTRLPVSLC